ncbi:MAG: hypothetical protein KatS3mg010_0965 [Acidimicrobiia bacterium]|nr:MAG: hypothetical protein KatS3mg010_0965 [Acidimicrobiia bacterium]
MPGMAAAGRRLLYQFGPGPGYLATVRDDGSRRLHPDSQRGGQPFTCPIERALPSIHGPRPSWPPACTRRPASGSSSS